MRLEPAHPPLLLGCLDRAGRILEANTTAGALLGVPRNELVDVPLQAFMEQEDADEFHRLRMRVLASRSKQARGRFRREA